MKSGIGRTLAWGVIVTACLIASSVTALAGNCALYARAVTGVDLYGSAGGWWDEAAGFYQRGHVPEVGSILVFQRTGFTPSGHVAVVSKIVGPGEILVDQSNWYHGRVTHDTPVIDTSPDRDWSSVAVMNIGTGEFGRNSPTYGFVYPNTGSRDNIVAREAGEFDPYVAATRAAYEPGPHGDLFHFAVATDSQDGRAYYRQQPRGHARMKYRGRQKQRGLSTYGRSSSRFARPAGMHSWSTHRAHAATAARPAHTIAGERHPA